jgi:uncharacterized pyridoxal phosphate-containing UPF0001 family protein
MSCLRGLMIIPQTGNQQAFTQLAEIRQQLLATIPTLNATQFDTLSMGMSRTWTRRFVQVVRWFV